MQASKFLSRFKLSCFCFVFILQLTFSIIKVFANIEQFAGDECETNKNINKLLKVSCFALFLVLLLIFVALLKSILGIKCRTTE